MTKDSRNLTGAWFGSFGYLGTGQEDVSFIAALEEVDGAVSGTTSEPNSIGDGSDHLSAVISGARDGGEVTFVKMYDGASDAAHSVAYAGTINDDGTRISGFWQLESWSGGFEMNRTQIQEEELEELEAAEERAHAPAATR